MRREADMRTGWLLWQESLEEFLYFEDITIPPDPNNYTARWVESGGGRRKKSRNLWVYHAASGHKHFSITTEAGAKIQPYFIVPPPDALNLFYFRVQGEPLEDGTVRIWLTDMTAGYLQHLLGCLDREVVELAIMNAAHNYKIEESSPVQHSYTAIPVILKEEAYRHLCIAFKGVSDEHRMQLLIKALK